jgi:transaldolase
MDTAAKLIHEHPGMELIWASPRELLNVIQADSIGCDIITATPDVLKKLDLIGKDLVEYSRETVQMFYDDACKSGFNLPMQPEVHPTPMSVPTVAAQGAA